MTLDELIAKLMAVTEGTRILDGQIMFALYAKPAGTRGYLWPEDDPSWSFAFAFDGPVSEETKRREQRAAAREGTKPKEWIEFEHGGHWILMNDLRVPCLTTSIDAALTLVPEGHRWLIDKRPYGHSRQDGYRAEVYRQAYGYLSDRSDVPTHWGPTPALALCIAALKARAVMQKTATPGEG